MKEFPLNLDGYKKGLRDTKRDNRKRGACVELSNARVDKDGIGDLREVQSPFTDLYFYNSGISLNAHPFPQLIKGRSKTFLCLSTLIKEVTRGTLGSWTAATLNLYDAYNSGNSGYIRSGNAWQLIDFFDTWLLVNGQTTVFQIKDEDDLYGFSDKVLTENFVTITAGCEHYGRAVIGGFSPTNFWNTAWMTFWDSWMNSNASVSNDNMTLGSNWVLWTAVGAPDLLWLFYPTIAQNGLVSGDPFSSAEPLIFDMLKRGDSGFMPMSWPGTVQKIIPLGRGLMVYGDEGISHLTPLIEPDPGFGEKKISDVGIANVGAVAGNDSQQMFIDKAGHLWHVSAEGIQDLDYHEYFEDMTAPIIVSFNEHDKDFYFSDGADCYLYHKGLSKTWQTVMSCFYDKGNVVGIYREIDDTVDTYP